MHEHSILHNYKKGGDYDGWHQTSRELWKPQIFRIEARYSESVSVSCLHTTSITKDFCDAMHNITYLNV